MKKENFDYTNATVRLWLLAFQTGDLLRMCTERLFSEYDITTENYDLLVTVKYLGDRVNIVQIASWLRRSPNSISMLVDRMVKGGLVRRIRDRKDRRVVYVSITSKGEHILELANPGCWEVIKAILAPLSYEERRTFLSLFDVINRQALQYLNPGEDVQEMMKKREDLHAELMKRLPPYAWMSVSEPKHRGGKKKL
jgi:DNA-binding MarR family transcriptional regulator